MTRQYEIKKLTKLVDNGSPNPIPLGKRIVEVGQGEGGSTIDPDAWRQFMAVAKYIYSTNKEAEVADVFECIRLNVLHGDEYSKSVIERADREVATDCGPW